MDQENKVKSSEEKLVELEQELIVLAIPASSCEVTISAKIFHNGELIEAHSTLGFEEVRAAIKEAQECYIPSDAVFSLTPLGEKYLEELKARYRDCGDDEEFECT